MRVRVRVGVVTSCLFVVGLGGVATAAENRPASHVDARHGSVPIGAADVSVGWIRMPAWPLLAEASCIGRAASVQSARTPKHAYRATRQCTDSDR
ncbi:MAG: hypothetical protein QOG53_3135 [Frankiales bacterium]|jgi:hypothetical protein|nr:hypothetical protein [Frankiales bacterium]